MTAPRPLSLPPDCQLWVDGKRYADGQPTELDEDPVALDDLRVVWGRSNTLDQPSPATCSFSVLDVPGGRRFPELLHIGGRIKIRASAVIYPDPTVSTIPVLIPGPIVNGTATGSGTTSNLITATEGSDGAAVLVTYPPKAYSSDPSAWDTVPRTAAGQQWRVKVTLGYPITFLGWRGYAAELRPVSFTSPTGGGAALPVAQSKPSPTTGDTIFDLTFTPPAGVWLGFQIRVYPTGPRWVDLTAGSWSSLDGRIWDELARWSVRDAQMLAPAAGAVRSGSVFAGRITDMEARYDEAIGGTVVDVIAQDDTGELANRYVGDTPWAAEALQTRFGRVVTASGQSTTWTVDPGVQAVQVSYKDVDSQPATRLLQELAQSVAGVLWSATSLATGPFLRLEDVNARAPLNTLAVSPITGLVEVVINPDLPATAITLSACSVILEPVRWTQNTEDSATRVAVVWKEQTIDPGPPSVVKPTDRTVTVTDTNLEEATGRRHVSVSTILALQADARKTADSLLGRLTAQGWRVSGLVLDLAFEPLDPDLLDAVMRILDGATRLGLPILLTDLPEWTPLASPDEVALYLEGGRFTSTAGRWTLELLVSDAQSQGAAGVVWNDLPAAWVWNKFEPAISWGDLAGVGI